MVKQSHYRPGEAWGFQEFEAVRFQDNRHVKVVRSSALCTGRLYPQETFLVLISLRGWVDPRVIVRPEKLCQRKNPMTPSGIKPANFRLVAQCLNQLRYLVPPPNKCTMHNYVIDSFTFVRHFTKKLLYVKIKLHKCACRVSNSD
jgi:hypothetical protein